jgi:type IV pilus assembly protein PilV
MKITGKQQRGVGLIEVMMALLVLAIGVLGYAGMQLTALKAAEDANNFLTNEAAMAAYTNVDDWPDRSVTPGKKPAELNDCITKSCSSDDLASWDINMLAWQAANRLPGGMIAVDECQHAAGISCVVISWNEDEPGDCMTNDGVNTDEGTSCVVLEVAR